jgi:hypothetical protein
VVVTEVLVQLQLFLEPPQLMPVAAGVVVGHREALAQVVPEGVVAVRLLIHQLEIQEPQIPVVVAAVVGRKILLHTLVLLQVQAAQA